MIWTRPMRPAVRRCLLDAGKIPAWLPASRRAYQLVQELLSRRPRTKPGGDVDVAARTGIDEAYAPCAREEAGALDMDIGVVGAGHDHRRKRQPEQRHRRKFAQLR